MTPMNKPRAYFGSMLDYFHKRIYAFGGSNSTKCLNDIEVYDIENDAWKSACKSDPLQRGKPIHLGSDCTTGGCGHLGTRWFDARQ